MTLYIYALWRHNKLQVDCVIRLIPAEHASRQLARPLSVGDRNYSHRRKKERKKEKETKTTIHTHKDKEKEKGLWLPESSFVFSPRLVIRQRVH